jgi:hypothetical protein
VERRRRLRGPEDLAFQHGIAMAVILAAVLAASRYALALQRGEGWPIADAVAIAGTIGVLGHLAAVWRDGSNPMRRLDVTVTHAVALVGGRRPDHAHPPPRGDAAHILLQRTQPTLNRRE